MWRVGVVVARRAWVGAREHWGVGGPLGGETRGQGGSVGMGLLPILVRQSLGVLGGAKFPCACMGQFCHGF